MASNSHFLSYWGSYCKDTLKQLFWGDDQGLKYSEGLLNTLYYETDVGCIPRGIKLDSGNIAPKHGNTENWNKQIQSCYWCVDDDTSWNGICCSKECLFYLHDWCIERIEYFTKRRFCRLPGCDKNTTNDHLYCDAKHKAKFDGAFPQWANHKSIVKKVIREGPTWYKSEQTRSGPNLANSMSGKVINDNNKVKSSTKSSEKIEVNKKQQGSENTTCVSCYMDFPIKLRTAMIFETDIGLIPRVTPDEHQLTSRYSSSPNWIRKIKGCYQCGSKSTTPTGNSNFCRLLCYFVFYEWCLRFMESHANVRMCKNTGCDRDAAIGFACCNKEHALALEEKYKQVKSRDIERLIKVGPSWYQRCDFPQDSAITQACQAQQTHTIAPVQQNPPSFSPSMVFSWNLTQVLFYCTDVGAIPREMCQFMSPPVPAPIHNANWNTQINQCYWCFSKPIQNNLSCSRRCFYLLNEWIHCKYTQTTQNRLCRVLRCDLPPAKGFDCCNRAHSAQYDQFKEYSPLLKSTEFALGPRWYQDFSTQHIDFYNRDEPFYELTNFYACNNLVIDGISWPTTEHYFQANKFAGTPYFRYISYLQAPRDAFNFSRNPGVQRWIRSNWPTTKISVMLQALRNKYVQNQDLADILVRTGSKQIYEHTRNDKFWGDGGDSRNGTNKLGELLMVVRRELQSGSLIPIMTNPMQHFQINKNISSPQLINYPQLNMPFLPQQQTNVDVDKAQLNSPTKVVQNNNQDATLVSNNVRNNKSQVQTQGAKIDENLQGTGPKEVKEESHLIDFKAELKFTKVPNMNDSETANVGNTCNNAPLLTPGEALYPLPENYESPFNIGNEMSDQQEHSDSDVLHSKPTNPFYSDYSSTEMSQPVDNINNPFSQSVVFADTVQHGNINTIQSPTSGMHSNEQNSSEINSMNIQNMPESDLPLIDLTTVQNIPDNQTIGSSLSVINFNLAHVKSQSQSTDPDSTNENTMDTI